MVCLQGFELLIRATFSTPDDLKVFKQHWRKLADHCKAHEPETLSYELLESDKISNEILIYERYAHAPKPHSETHTYTCSHSMRHG